jgi:hypothetical protein
VGSVFEPITLYYLWKLVLFTDIDSLRANPLARSLGQVKLDSDTSENYERICLNKQDEL